MGVFGILLLLVWWAIRRSTALPRRRAILVALGLTVLYAALDELHQGTVSGRHASPIDVGIDAVGAVGAIAAVRAGSLLVRRRGGDARGPGDDATTLD
jgi:VanZ family protein